MNVKFCLYFIVDKLFFVYINFHHSCQIDKRQAIIEFTSISPKVTCKPLFRCSRHPLQWRTSVTESLEKVFLMIQKYERGKKIPCWELKNSCTIYLTLCYKKCWIATSVSAPWSKHELFLIHDNPSKLHHNLKIPLLIKFCIVGQVLSIIHNQYLNWREWGERENSLKITIWHFTEENILHKLFVRHKIGTMCVSWTFKEGEK